MKLTPSERILAVTVPATDAQRHSMLNYLLGCLVPIAERPDPTPDSIARAVERSKVYAMLTPNGPIGGRLS